MSANFLYKLRVLSGARFSKLNDVATEINRRCGKSKSSIIRDIYHCYRRFGSGYYDYITYHFYELDDKMRDTYMTRMRSKKLITFLNNPEKAKIFDNKNKFDKVFMHLTVISMRQHAFTMKTKLGLVKCLISHAERAPRLSECQTSKMLRHSMTI